MSQTLTAVMREILYDRYLQRLLKCVLIIADVGRYLTSTFIWMTTLRHYTLVFVEEPGFDFQLEIFRF